jgi:hypothetical protein
MTVRAFGFEVDRVFGARIVARHDPLMGGCMCDDEVDHTVELLKDDLDAVAVRMKAAIRQEAKEPIFDA